MWKRLKQETHSIPFHILWNTNVQNTWVYPEIGQSYRNKGKKCTTTLCCKWKRLLESRLLSWRWSRQGHTSTYTVSTLEPLIKIRVETSLLWFWPWQWCFSVNLILSKRAWNVSAQASKSCCVFWQHGRQQCQTWRFIRPPLSVATHKLT